MSAIFGPMEVIDGKKGTRITAIGNCWREKERRASRTDFVAVCNAQLRSGPCSRCGLDADAVWPGQGSGTAEARERVLSESGPRTGH